MADYGVTDTGFNLKRVYDILNDLKTQLGSVSDPVTGELLTPALMDENDPFIQLVNALADSLGVCWDQLQLCYNQFDPSKATGAGLSGLVQLNGLRRLLGETDAQLRARQQASTANTARGMIEDCYSAIANLTGVTFCKVYQNITTVTDARGLVGKSVAAVVRGGTTQDIIDTLFVHSPTGMRFNGNTTGIYTDGLGNQYAVAFTRPVEVPIYIDIEVTVVDPSLFPPAGGDNIKNSVYLYVTQGAPAIGIPTGYDTVGYLPGSSIYGSELYVPVNKTVGIRVDSIKVGRSASPSTEAVVIAYWEMLTLALDHITITVNN